MLDSSPQLWEARLPPDEIAAELRELARELVAIRRDVHQNPELGFEEVRTAALVSKNLSESGYRVQAEVGGTGVVGVLDGGATGPTLAIRADIDALPIGELTGLPFASGQAPRTTTTPGSTSTRRAFRLVSKYS
jgi:metal-dependent amidase/aminoacylase/carboxypeptidase family protein